MDLSRGARLAVEEGKGKGKRVARGRVGSEGEAGQRPGWAMRAKTGKRVRGFGEGFFPFSKPLQTFKFFSNTFHTSTLQTLFKFSKHFKNF
jgi:hypothetical protein